MIHGAVKTIGEQLTSAAMPAVERYHLSGFKYLALRSW